VYFIFSKIPDFAKNSGPAHIAANNLFPSYNFLINSLSSRWKGLSNPPGIISPSISLTLFRASFTVKSGLTVNPAEVKTKSLSYEI